MITADSIELLHLAEHWQKGVMPFAGGLYDQPAIIRDAMRVITEQRNAIQAARVRAAKRG